MKTPRKQMLYRWALVKDRPNRGLKTNLSFGKDYDDGKKFCDIEMTRNRFIRGIYHYWN